MASGELVDMAFKRILNEHGELPDLSRLSEPERVVLLVYHTFGIIGNGGFQHLFEGNIPGDPEYLLTRQAYQTIGAKKAIEAFQKAFAVFPKGTPPKKIERQLEMYRAKYTLMDAMKNRSSSPDTIYFDAMKETEELLEAYVRLNLSRLGLKTQSD